MTDVPGLTLGYPKECVCVSRKWISIELSDMQVTLSQLSENGQSSPVPLSVLSVRCTVWMALLV